VGLYSATAAATVMWQKVGSMVLSIGEKTISEIQELARRDDVCSILLPSDIRVILTELKTKMSLLKKPEAFSLKLKLRVIFFRGLEEISWGYNDLLVWLSGAKATAKQQVVKKG